MANLGAQSSRLQLAHMRDSGQLGFIDFSAIGSTITNLLPSAIDAYGKRQVAKVYAKAAAVPTPAAAQPAVSVNTLQPVGAASPVAFDFKPLLKPALVGTALLAGLMIVPRLIPSAR